jgi:hypothetical protein
MATQKQDNEGKVEIFCRYIIRKGKKIYPPKGQKVFHFWAKPKKFAA